MPSGNILCQVGSRYAGATDLAISFVMIVWYTHKILSPLSSWSFPFDTGVVGIGSYFLLSSVFPILLIYSTFCYASDSARKCLAVMWCIFRGASVTTVAIYVVVSHEANSMSILGSSIVAGILVFWMAGISTVIVYINGLNDEIMGQPLTRKRKLSSVSVLSEESGVLKEDHLKQLKQFQGYIRRTSWCSDRVHQSGNTLQVPEYN